MYYSNYGGFQERMHLRRVSGVYWEFFSWIDSLNRHLHRYDGHDRPRKSKVAKTLLTLKLADALVAGAEDQVSLWGVLQESLRPAATLQLVAKDGGD